MAEAVNEILSERISVRVAYARVFKYSVDDLAQIEDGDSGPGRLGRAVVALEHQIVDLALAFGEAAVRWVGPG